MSMPSVIFIDAAWVVLVAAVVFIVLCTLISLIIKEWYRRL